MDLLEFCDRVVDFASNDCLKRGWTFHPLKELDNAIERAPIAGFHKGSSIGGRVVCLIMIPTHLLGLVGKPLIYSCCAAGGVVLLPISIITMSVIEFAGIFTTVSRLPEEMRPWKTCCFIVQSAYCVIASFYGQVLQICKAAAGVFHPGAYFRSPRAPLYDPYENRYAQTYYHAAPVASNNPPPHAPANNNPPPQAPVHNPIPPDPCPADC